MPVVARSWDFLSPRPSSIECLLLLIDFDIDIIPVLWAVIIICWAHPVLYDVIFVVVAISAESS